MNKKITYIIFVLIFLCGSIEKYYAQQTNNLITKNIGTTNDTITVDTISIVPNSFYIKNVSITLYKIDEINSKLIWLTKPDTDSVTVVYRTFPYKLNRTLQELNYNDVKNNYWVKPYRPQKNNTSSKLLDLGKIEYAGSFGRGLSFGNAQDAVLNSNLNLQLSGMLADSIEISASISDQNLPIQPDGSSTQLNEIDRIFLQLKRKKSILSVGDIDLRQNNHYYLNFYKRLQGLSYENNIQITPKISNNLLVSGAMARGKFTANTFQGLEGNQGPYRLQGANNEFFFIVLAGTERVFVDGEPLQRGEDQDYIINYNTAEITFTPKILITKDKRIRVEFEYSDRNYLNTQLFVSNQLQIKNNLKVGFSYFSNGDSKNSPINIELDAPQKTFLQNLGDSVQNSFFPTVRNDTLAAGKILYKTKDTIHNGIFYQTFVFSTDPDSAKYRVTFTELGAGKGNYVVSFNGANGKVYKWVGPIGNTKQGSYEPVEYLVAPKKQQLMAISTEYTINPNNVVQSEVAFSKNDVNTFSNKDKGNDNGLAGKIKYLNSTNVSKKLTLKSQVAVEHNNKNFRTIERLRSPEFNRDWNLLPVLPFVDETLGALSFNLNSTKGNTIKTELQQYNRGNGYKGSRFNLGTNHVIKGWTTTSSFSYTSTTDSFQNGFFIRPTVNVSKTLSKLKNYRLSFNYFLEQNELLNKIGDSLNPLSIAFDSYKVLLNSNETKKNKWGLAYTYRNNKTPIKKTLETSDKAQDFEVFTSLTQNPNRIFNIRATYRALDVQLPEKVNYKSDKTLLGRSEYTFTEWKGLLQGTMIYESGSGQEQQRDFAFLQVLTGQGEFYWRDYNNDGIQQLNEFEVAQFRDQRQFIKIFVPTNRFVKANFNNFSYSVQLNPKSILKKNKYKGYKQILSRSYLKSSLQIQKKEISNNVINGNPFKTKSLDTSLISLNRAISNTYSFNKFSTKWGLDINQDFRTNKSLLTYGYETRDLNTIGVKLRWNIKKSLQIESVAKQVTNKLTTPAFNNRNYEIKNNAIESKISYLYKSKLRIEATGSKDSKNNAAIFGGEKADITSFVLDSKFNALQSASITGRFSFVNINYVGNANTTVGFIMLDALLPGKNYLWNVDLIKTLKNNLEITLRYEGRQSAGGKTIHIGSATMRANFY